MTLTNSQTRDIEALFHPYTPLHKLKESGSLVVESGSGVFISDDTGKCYLEGMAGLWCAGLGFGDDEMIEAAVEQMRRLPYYHLFGAKGTEPAIALAEELKGLAPVEIGKVLYCSSGSEANDTQVKLAWYYNNAIGRPKKKKIISRVKAYHGVTVMAASLTGLAYTHNSFDLPVDRVLHTDCPHYYLFGEEGQSEEEFVAALVRNLEELIDREGGETIAAMIAEPIMGAGGVIVPPESYFEAIQPVLDAHDIYLIADEVITGFGRTGNWWGSQTMNMRPQTISVAKQLTAAYAPLGAVLVPEEMYEAAVSESAKLGTFGHGFTYGGHPLSCALGVKAIEIYKKRNIIDHVRTVSKVFEERVQRLAEHPLVGNVRSRGLMGGIELVKDKTKRESFAPTDAVGGHMMKALESHGVILRAIGDTLAVCPPMIINEEEICFLFDKIEVALDETSVWVAKLN